MITARQVAAIAYRDVLPSMGTPRDLADVVEHTKRAIAREHATCKAAVVHTGVDMAIARERRNGGRP